RLLGGGDRGLPARAMGSRGESGAADPLLARRLSLRRDIAWHGKLGFRPNGAWSLRSSRAPLRAPRPLAPSPSRRGQPAAQLCGDSPGVLSHLVPLRRVAAGASPLADLPVLPALHRGGGR